MQNGQPEISRAFGFKLSAKKASFMDLLRPYALVLSCGCALLLITNLIMVLLPLLINGGVSLIEKNQTVAIDLFFFKIDIPNIYWLLLAVIALSLVGAILRTLSRRVVFDVGRTIERDVRAKLFFQVSTLDDRFFSKVSVGDLMNHLTTDMTNIRMVTGFAALNLMNIFFVFCFTIPLLLKIDVMLAFSALIPFPLVIIATGSITKKMFQASKDYQEQLSHMVSHIQENLLGAHVVRLFHQQREEGERFRLTNNHTYDAGVKLARVRAFMLPVMRLMVGIAVGLVLYVGGRAVISGRITLGDFVEANARILQLAWPAMSVGFVMSIYSRGQASLTRVNDLFAYRPAIKDGEQIVTSVQKIDVRNLNLKQTNDPRDNISFSVSRGQLLGVVGASGSYKSTLLKILYRRIKVAPGMVFFDGHDLNNLTMSSLYEQVSVVSPDTFLFHKSIRSNVCFARPDATDDEVREVLREVRLDQEIGNLRSGVDTVIGERGITLSGGQRQRVVLARALLAKRPIIIMDDALSSVDADTERHIIAHLQNRLKDSIAIIATHRLSAIRDADQILVMEQGRVAETGTHARLINDGVLYQQLWGFDQLERRRS